MVMSVSLIAVDYRPGTHGNRQITQVKSSADNVCEPFGPRLRLTKYGSKCLTLFIFMKEFLEMVNLEKDQQMRYSEQG